MCFVSFTWTIAVCSWLSGSTKRVKTAKSKQKLTNLQSLSSHLIFKQFLILRATRSTTETNQSKASGAIIPFSILFFFLFSLKREKPKTNNKPNLDCSLNVRS
ncbi:hypothetical protein VIGAN_08042000 [Vigna angularis var. angularis]|uniref:Secreted protein n=1 Tax=Vigna angularis var. angularis TaxID=157739 RepID=A0A0S3SM09_PHAAN|nr:hypothetical protein VIGAN_08042000 [Vigna angularis var. angularis]